MIDRVTEFYRKLFLFNGIFSLIFKNGGRGTKTGIYPKLIMIQHQIWS